MNNVSVCMQYYGRFLPEIILLALCDTISGTLLISCMYFVEFFVLNFRIFYSGGLAALGFFLKRLGGIKGCKYKTSSWHLNGFLPEWVFKEKSECT